MFKYGYLIGLVIDYNTYTPICGILLLNCVSMSYYNKKNKLTINHIKSVYINQAIVVQLYTLRGKALYIFNSANICERDISL